MRKLVLVTGIFFGRLYSLFDRSPSLDCCSQGSRLLTVLGFYSPRRSLILSLYLNLLSYYSAVLDPSFPRYIILLADLENLILSSDLAGLLHPLELYVPRLVCYLQPSPVIALVCFWLKSIYPSGSVSSNCGPSSSFHFDHVLFSHVISSSYLAKSAISICGGSVVVSSIYCLMQPASTLLPFPQYSITLCHSFCFPWINEQVPVNFSNITKSCLGKGTTSAHKSFGGIYSAPLSACRYLISPFDLVIYPSSPC